MCCIISSLYFALLVDECCVTTWQKKGRDKVYTVGATQEQIRAEELEKSLYTLWPRGKEYVNLHLS